MTASVVAGELGIPLFFVSFDALITKFMGKRLPSCGRYSTLSAMVRGVYFFDERGAIGPQRELANDVGEIRRVLNSFLQMVESEQSHSLILAVTNHLKILEYAFFRRLDEVIGYGLPSGP